MASIKKRITAGGETRWDARVRSGGRVHTRTHRTRALAEAWAREAEDAVRSGQFADPSAGRQSLAAYSATWLDSRRLAPRTRQVYEDLLERRILPDLGGSELRQISPDSVRRWWSRQPSGPYSAKGYRLLRSICATAHDDGVIARQPCRIPNAGKDGSPERPLVTPEDIAALVAAADDRAKAPILVAAWCGLRRGELLGLERHDFSELHPTVTVERSVQWLPGEGRVVLPPKSAAGQRTVHLPGLVAEAVETHMSRFVVAHGHAPFVVGVSGTAASPRTLHRWWDDARREVGLGHIRFHDLRHAAGTMAAWTGATSTEIQRFMGHSSRAAADRYQHAALSRQAEMAGALDALARSAAADQSVVLARDGRAMGPGKRKAQVARKRG